MVNPAPNDRNDTIIEQSNPFIDLGNDYGEDVRQPNPFLDLIYSGHDHEEDVKPILRSGGARCQRRVVDEGTRLCCGRGSWRVHV